MPLFFAPFLLLDKTNLLVIFKHFYILIYEPRSIGTISLKSENIGTDIMPKYVLTADVIDVDSSHNVSEVEYLFKRKIDYGN